MTKLPPHGHISRYKYHGCKCLTCMDGWRDYNRTRRREQAYGRWQPTVDAGIVRAHLKVLRESGLGIRRIAELAGVAQSTVARLLYTFEGCSPRKVVQRKTAQRILAVRPHLAILADGAVIEATGTRRRIQALVARGWTHRALAPHLGVNELYVGDLAQQPAVTARLARKVVEVYDLLWDADPLEHGVSQWSVNRSRALAERRGWAPPMAWDDDRLDDPAARPDLGSHWRRWGETQAEIAWLLAAGETAPNVIAARLNLSESAVQRSLARARGKGVA
ncbi:helix-turn-helix domain-containing protein [Streptomyces sp. NPDC049577]|uniref:helix-turn-helix domain-containing protein n=1 Tax=Streptomyces sp. NPDC049577 TaxID=3155153 RepID=UPI0034167132